MAITTVDVVTNITTSEEAKNATVVLSCMRTGEFQTLDATFEKSLTYNQLEDKYTNRFDDIYYYNVVSKDES
jgi:hypothetical protein